MNKNLLIGIGVLVALVVAYFMFKVNVTNTLVDKDQEVKQAWGNVETQYQRRLDLIPNLANVVKKYADHEKEVLIGVTEARSKASSIQVDPSNLDANSLAKFTQAQSGVSSALGRLMVVMEKYPDLKANENFRDLQAQLEGTENRIQRSREVFNNAATEFNKYMLKFPGNMFASGYKEKPLFQADTKASEAPKVFE